MRLLAVPWPEVPALPEGGKSLKSPRGWGFQHVALVLPYFRKDPFSEMPALLPMRLPSCQKGISKYRQVLCRVGGHFVLCWLRLVQAAVPVRNAGEPHQMRIPQGSPKFSLRLLWGVDSSLPALGGELCSPRALALVPLSSLPALSLPKPICKQEFASCLMPVTRLRCRSAPGRGCVSGGSAWLGAAAPALARRLALPGFSWPSCSTGLRGTAECGAETFPKLTWHYPNIPGTGWGSGKVVGLGI